MASVTSSICSAIPANWPKLMIIISSSNWSCKNQLTEWRVGILYVYGRCLFSFLFEWPLFLFHIISWSLLSCRIHFTSPPPLILTASDHLVFSMKLRRGHNVVGERELASVHEEHSRGRTPETFLRISVHGRLRQDQPPHNVSNVLHRTQPLHSTTRTHSLKK